MSAKKLPWNTLAKLPQWCPSPHGKSLLFCESLPAPRKRNSVEFEWKGYNQINTFSHIYFKTVYEEAGKRLNCCFSKKWWSLSLNFIFDKLCYLIGCIFLNWWYFHMVDNGRYFLFWCWKSDQEIGKKNDSMITTHQSDICQVSGEYKDLHFFPLEITLTS